MTATSATRERLLIVGHGMVAQRLLESLLERDAVRYDITVIGEEPRAAYDRVHLSAFLAGRTEAELSVVPEGFFAKHAVKLLLGDPVVVIDRDAKLARTAAGRALPYVRLVLATGSYPFVPPIPGKERAGCFVYRTIDDLIALREASRQARSGVVIGGGLLGLEAAKALLDLGLETHVVEFAPRLMAVQVDEGGGRLLRKQIEALGGAARAALRGRRGNRSGHRRVLGGHPSPGRGGAVLRDRGGSPRRHRDRRALRNQRSGHSRRR